MNPQERARMVLTSLVQAQAIEEHQAKDCFDDICAALQDAERDGKIKVIEDITNGRWDDVINEDWD